MAKRRLNTRFVAIASIVVAGGLTVAMLFVLLVNRRDPAVFVRRGEDEYKRGNLVAAEAEYRKAIQRSKSPDLKVRVRYGEILQELGRTDQAFADQGRQQWEAVLQVDPTYFDALKLLLRREVEVIEQSPIPHPTTLQRLSNYADAILHGKADDVHADANKDIVLQAKAYKEIATIASWLGDIVTPDDVVKAAVTKLDALQAEDPSNPDIPYYRSMALVKQAKELRTAGQGPDAQKLEREAFTTFSKAVAAQPENAVMKLRFYQMLASLSTSLDTVVEDEYIKDREEYLSTMRKVLSDAKDGVDKTGPDKEPAFTEVYVNYATFLRRQKNPKDLEKAEDVLRELLQKKPADQTARIALANFIHDQGDPKKLDEAIELLKRDIVDQGNRGVLSPHSKQLLEVQTYADLTTYLIEKFTRTTEPAARKKVQDEVNDYYQRLTEKNGVTPLTLKLKGKISLMRGDVAGAVEAIPQLERARDMLRQLSPNRKVRDWELEYLLASAYNDSHQSGLAKTQLWEIHDNVPTFIPAQKMLFRLLLAEHDPETAGKLYKEIQVLNPKDADLPKMKASLVLMSDQKVLPEDVARVFDSLPETSAAELRQKIPLAFLLRKVDKAVSLLEGLRAMPAPEGPGNVDTARTLVQVYVNQNKRDLAEKVVTEALAADPQNVAFKILRAQFDASDPAIRGDKQKTDEVQGRIEALTIDGINSMTVPVERELSLYNHYTGKRNAAEQAKAQADQAKDPLEVARQVELSKAATAEAMKHLDAAEKLEPENSKVLDVRFNQAVADKKWDVAAKLADRLGVLNVDEAHGAIYRYRLAILRGDVKRAEEVARQLVQDAPQFARSWLCYGEILKVQGQYEEAAGKYQLALEKQNESIEAYRGIIECFLALKKPDEAKRYIDQAVKRTDNAEMKERQIAWNLEFGKPEDAIAPREEAVQQNPNDPGPRLALGAAWWQVAQAQVQKGKPDEAHKAADKAKGIFTDFVQKWPDVKLAYAYLADVATYQQDFAGGEAALKAMAARDGWKDRPDPFMLLAQYYARFDKVDQAEANFAIALDKAKGDVEVQRQVAAYYYLEHKFDKALAVLDPKSTDRRVQQQMLEVMLASGKLTDAGKLLQRMIDANPNDAQLLASRGFLYLQLRQIPEAQAALDRAVEIEPRNGTALYYRGVLRMRQGPAGVDSAIKDLTTARDNTDASNVPQQVQTRLALGEALLMHTPPLVEDAVHELTRCVELQPNNKDVRMKLIERLGSLVTPQWNQVERLINEAKAMPGNAEDPDWRRVESSMWLQRNNPDKSLASIKEALVLAAKLNNPQRTLPLMQDYLNVLLRLKKFDVLKAECDAVLKTPGVDATAWWVYDLRARAEANGAPGANRADALNDFDKALEIAAKLRNDDAIAYIIQGIADTIGVDPAIKRVEAMADAGNDHWRIIGIYLYLSKNDFARAEQMLAKVMDPATLAKLTENEKKSAYGVAGSVYMMSAKYDRALDAYEKLLAMSPEDTVALNNLACLWTDYLDKPNPAKAITYSGRALEIMQKVNVPDPNVLDTHGWALINNNQVEAGIDFVQSALDRRNMMEAHYHLGVGLLKRQLVPEAVRELEKARKMMDERRNKGTATDPTMETKLNQALSDAKLQLTGPSAGTSDAAKP